MMSVNLKKVDHAALRTNQAFIIALSIAAFVTEHIWLAAAVGLAMLLGTLGSMPAFGFIYQRLLKPRRWVQPDVIPDNPEPHRFAQGFGAVVMIGGAVALFAEAAALGWALVWVVIALAALNLFGGFCVGCAVYYWLNRLHAPGFPQSPPEGTIPGMRPKGSA